MSDTGGSTDRFSEILEEYITRTEQGEHIDTGTFASQHHAFESELRRFFEDNIVVDEEMKRLKMAALAAGIGRRLNENGGSCHGPGPEFTDVVLPRIAKFRLLHEIGSGSQGIVYKAEQIGTKRTVALKVIREGIFASKRERYRFEREIELVSRLGHPNIVTIYECGQDAGRDYYAMEYVSGNRLDAYLAKHDLDIRSIVNLFLQLGDAVRFAHQRGIIHRDLKPSNVLVDPAGNLRVLDFGLAKLVEDPKAADATAITEIGHFAGTWLYASPEQARRDATQIDVRTDVYALGVILYEMLTDALPYPITNEPSTEIARHILETPPTPPSRWRREIDNELETIVLCALQKTPERRYQSVFALLSDLQRYLHGDAIEAKRDSRRYVLRKALRQYRRQVAAGAAVLVALIAFAVTVSILYSQAIVARATVGARADLVRESQKYLLGKLDELTFVHNRLADLAAAYPDLPEIRQLQTPSRAPPEQLFESVASTMPSSVLAALVTHNQESHTVERWLQSNDSYLENIEHLALESRFTFGVASTIDSTLALVDTYGSAYSALRICEALTARAIRQFDTGNHPSALRSLDAARRIAVNIGDGRLLHHKLLSFMARGYTYRVCLHIFNICENVDDASQYVEWMAVDPPIADPRLAFAAERQRLAQVIELATTATPNGNEPYLDDRILQSEFQFSAAADMTLIDRGGRTRVAAQTALNMVDTLISDLEQLDASQKDEWSEQYAAILTRAKMNPAWHILRSHMTSYGAMYNHRHRVLCARHLVRTAARLLGNRCTTGQWPSNCSTILETESESDPFSEGRRCALQYVAGSDDSARVILRMTTPELDTEDGNVMHESVFAPALR